MKNLLALSAIATMLVLTMACGGNEGPKESDDPMDRILWTRPEEAPAWVNTPPEATGDEMFFVGLSRVQAVEKLARQDAQRDVRRQVVEYLNTFVDNQYKEARVDFGLAGDVVDPTASGIALEKYYATGVASKVKVKDNYIEFWQKPTGRGYQVYSLAAVPYEAIDGTVKNTAADMRRQAEEAKKKANEARAKQQAENAVNFWSSLEENGLQGAQP